MSMSVDEAFEAIWAVVQRPSPPARPDEIKSILRVALDAPTAVEERLPVETAEQRRARLAEHGLTEARMSPSELVRKYGENAWLAGAQWTDEERLLATSGDGYENS